MLKLGHHSYICEPYNIRGNMNNITVGNYTSIARDVIFDSGFNHDYKMVTTFPLRKLDDSLPSNIKMRGDIRIGADCWLCEAVMINSGVTIGDGCVIGMNSVVTKDVPPFTVVAGAKRWLRFTNEQIEQLLGIAWWNWPDERVLANAKLLLSEDIDNFIENYE